MTFKEEIKSKLRIEDGIIKIWEQVLPDGDWEGRTATIDDICELVEKSLLNRLPKEMEGKFEDDFVAGKKEQGYFRNGYNQCLQKIRQIITE